jgi:hypothetical protein
MQGKFIFGDCIFTKVPYLLREQKNIPSLLVYTLYLITRIAYTVHVFTFFLSEELPADLGKQNIQRICEAGS